jgi:hypothetical protein
MASVTRRPSPGHGLDPGRPAAVGELAAVHGGAERADVAGAVLGRDDQCEGLVCGVPEQHLRRPVPGGDLALGVHGDDRICRGGHGLGDKAGAGHQAGLLNR